MTTDHEEEDTLARIVCGDLDPDGEEARQLFARQPRLRLRLERMRRLTHQLDVLGREESMVVRAAAAAGASPTDAVAAARFGARLRARRRRVWLGVGALAAAALVVAAVVLSESWRRTGVPVLPERLGPAAAPVVVAPNGKVEGPYGPLRYTGVRPPGAWFRFVVTSRAGGAVADSGAEYQDPVWAPDEAGWPDEIAIEVQVHDPASGEVRTHRARAWR